MRFLPLLALLICLPCRADLYEWTDANGQKHFSDSVPPNQSSQAKKRQVDTPPPTQSAVEAQNVRDRQAAAVHTLQKKQEAQQEAAAAAAASAKDKDSLCHALRNRDNFLGTGGRMYTQDGDNRHYYSDAEVAEQRQTLEQQIQENCN